MRKSVLTARLALCLLLGVLIGVLLSTWAASLADATSGTVAAEPLIGEAVPAAAHLSLWQSTDHTVLLPVILHN